MYKNFDDPIPIPETGKLNPTCPVVIKSHMDALDRMLDHVHMEDYPGDDHDFTVLYVGGGRYWPGVVIGCKLLRMHGYHGRIEVWYGHNDCREEVFPEDVDGLDVHLVDALKVAEETRPRILRGWEAKIHALRHCRARRVFFLDGDAYLTMNPEVIAGNVDGFAFWSEPRSKIRWSNVWSGHRRPMPGVQGGQFIIDRHACWPFLLLVDWVCQHSDFYFAHMFGDQDAMSLALSLLQETPYTIIGPIRGRYGSILCDWQSRIAVIHRVRSKLFPPKDWHARDCQVQYDIRLPLENMVHYMYAQLCERYSMVETFRSLHAKHRWRSDRLHDSWISRKISDRMISRGYSSVVDAGCGDGWLGELLLKTVRQDVPGARLTGIDCVPDVLPRGSGLLGEYIVGDITDVEGIPDGDILLVKDVLHHWSQIQIERWLDKVVSSSRWRELAVIVDTRQEISDIPSGSFRGLDPDLFPLRRFSGWEVTRFGAGKALLFKSLRHGEPQ